MGIILSTGKNIAMKVLKICLVLIVLILSTNSLLAAKSVAISGSASGASEYQIRAVGGDSIIITLTGEKWVAEMGNDNDTTTSLINSFSGTNWNIIASELSYLNVVLYNDSTVVIGLPVIAGFDIYQNEIYTLTIPDNILLSQTALGSIATFTINYDVVTAIVGGTTAGGATETEISVGGETITLTIRNDIWALTLGQDNTISTDFLAGIKGTLDPWVISSLMDYTNIVRTNDTVVIVTLPADIDYALGADEAVRIDIPLTCLENTLAPVSINPAFTVSNQATSVNMTVSYSAPIDETDVRAGGTIILDLTGDKFAGDNATLKTIFLTSFSNGGASSWDTQVLSGITVNKDNSKKATITLPAAAGFDISASTTITPAIAPAAFQIHTVTDINTIPASFTILNDAVTAILGGTAAGGATETEISTGGETITLTIRNDIWALTLGQDNAISTAFLAGIKGTLDPWVITDLMDYTNIVRTNDTVVTVTLPADIDYALGANEAIRIDIPATSFENTSAPVSINPAFTVSNQATAVNMTVSYSAPIDETDVRAGGTIILDLTGDNFAVDNATLKTIFLTSFSNGGASSWDTQVLSGMAVNKNSKKRATITLPAAPGFDISASTTITPAIAPAAFEFHTVTNINPSPVSFIINRLPAVVTVAGPVSPLDFENPIRQGLGIITLTLTEDNWDPLIGENNIKTRDLVNAITGSSSGVNSWNNRVLINILGSDNGAANVSLSGNVVTINIPLVPLYDITSNDLITVDIPVGSITGTGTLMDNVGTFTIKPEIPQSQIDDPGLIENTLNGSIVTMTLVDDTFDGAVTLNPSHFTVNGPPTTTITNVLKTGPVTAQLTLGFTGDFEVNFTTFHITALNTGLTGSIDLTSGDITVTAVIEPVISDATIPDISFKIGSIVPVTITVVNDGGSTYTYGGGTIAGRALDSLKRISSTQYTGYFTVIEGTTDFPAASTIVVSNLKLNNGGIQGELFTKNIIQANDNIDAHRPVINSFIAIGNSHKIGDQIQLVAFTDGIGYTVVNALTNINGTTFAGPKMTMTGSGDIYNLFCLVEEGDNDVSVAGTLNANLVLRDPAGNESTVKVLNASNTVTIDAHKPVINTITIPNTIYKAGDIVTLTINTDAGTGYSLKNDSHVNNIYFSSGRLNLNYVSPGVYRITYTVLGTDVEVSPGNITARIILNDIAGNSSLPVTTIGANTAAIYTILPTASISGDAVICEDDSTILYVNLTGKKPWNFTVNDGSNDRLFSGINNSPYSYYVKPSVTTKYAVKSVFDVNLIQGTVSLDTAHILVNPKSDVHILELNGFYFFRTDIIESVDLVADSIGGVFSGPGVTASTHTFYPSIAGLAEIIPHVIRYDYTNLYGCNSFTTQNVNVIEATGVLNFSRPLRGTDNIMCYNDSPFDLNAVITGSDTIEWTNFELFKDEVYQGDITKNTDISITIDPSTLSEGTYEVKFKYFTKTELFITRTFIVEEIESPEFIGFDVNEMCSNDPQIQLRGTDTEGVFNGRGVTKVTNNYFFNPGSIGADSTYILTYTTTSVAGCSNSSAKSVIINLMPVIGFDLSDSCLSSMEVVNFSNASSDQSRVNVWLWEFGDISTGELLNYDNNINGTHIFSSPVSRTITLTGSTPEGCNRTFSRSVVFSDTPIARFTADNKCFSPGNSILIKGKESSAVRSITDFDWRITFRADSVVNFPRGTIDSINIQFNDVSIYPIELTVTTDMGCQSLAATDTLVLRPTIPLNLQDSYYEETFDDWGSWSPESLVPGNQNHSWLHNPSPSPLDTTPVDNSWFTILNGDSTVVISSMVSPCFNFTGMERPMISLNIFRKFSSENLEGASLQYTLNNGKTWFPIGKLDDGVNWYNSYLINNLPNVIGWTGNALNQDSTWIEVRHGLDFLAGNSNVQFRIAFVSNNYTTSSRFAFDDVKIRNKERLSLLEYFTNTGTSKPGKDVDVNSLFATKHHDFLKLEYHTSFPSATDPFNEFNRNVPGARTYFYAIDAIPYALLDGGTDISRRFDFSQAALSVNEDDISVSALNDPKIEIKIQSSITGNNLSAKINLVAKDSLPAGEKILFVVLYEKLVDLSGKNYVNVVKAVLPDAGGTAIYQAWNVNPEDTTKIEYNFVHNVSNMNMDVLRVAAFLQNDQTGEIYQAATNDTSTVLVGINPGINFSKSFEIYPNPAHDRVNLVFNGEFEKASSLQIYDQFGRKVYEVEIAPYEEYKSLEISHLTMGLYYIRLSSKGNLQAEVKKLIIY